MVVRIGEIVPKWLKHAKAIWFKEILDFSQDLNHWDGSKHMKYTSQCHISIYFIPHP
jgi:hypothetical protein